jgi:hypothetical protein
MEHGTHITIKRLVAAKLHQVQGNSLSQNEAEKLLKKRIRFSSKVREDLVAGLTLNYDKETAQALCFFRLI